MNNVTSFDEWEAASFNNSGRKNIAKYFLTKRRGITTEITS